MSTERAVEIFCLLVFGICGLSMLLRPTAWRAFLQELTNDGPAGALVLGVMTLGLGAFIVSFHRVWHGLMSALTIVGWIHVIEGALFFLAPSVAIGFCRWAGDESRTGMLRLAGFIGLAISIGIGVILASLQIGPLPA